MEAKSPPLLVVSCLARTPLLVASCLNSAVVLSFEAQVGSQDLVGCWKQQINLVTKKFKVFKHAAVSPSLFMWLQSTELRQFASAMCAVHSNAFFMSKHAMDGVDEQLKKSNSV